MATKLETRIIFSGAVRHLSQLRRNIRTNAERDLARVSRGDANAVSTHQADLANSRDVLARIVQVMQQQRVALDAFASRAEVDELIADAQEIQTSRY